MAGLKVHDVARRLNVSEKTVYKWLSQGLIPASRIGKTWIITDESLSALMNPADAARTATGLQTQSHPASGLGEYRRGADRSGVYAQNQEQLQSALAQLNEVTSGAVEHGISGVLGPRRLDPATPAAIAEELENAEGEVLLQGVGLREFFGDKDHAVILRRMASDDRPISVRAILVSPTGQFARARTIVEDGDQFADDALFRAGPLFGDSWRSLNVIASLKKASRESRKFRVDVRFVDHWPSTYLVLTGRCAFIETYHFGRTDPATEGASIDGLVPMFRVSGGSDYHSLLRNHFDYLWNGSNPFIPTQTLEQVSESVQVQV